MSWTSSERSEWPYVRLSLGDPAVYELAGLSHKSLPDLFLEKQLVSVIFSTSQTPPQEENG